jgi:hypothetical protein
MQQLQAYRAFCLARSPWLSLLSWPAAPALRMTSQRITPAKRRSALARSLGGTMDQNLEPRKIGEPLS